MLFRSDQALDQSSDHAWAWSRGLQDQAEALLEAVAEGSEESFELARGLADAVLGDELVRQAVEVRRLVEERSPFALVRAVELAAGVARRTAAPTLAPSHQGGGR